MAFHSFLITADISDKEKAHNVSLSELLLTMCYREELLNRDS